MSQPDQRNDSRSIHDDEFIELIRRRHAKRDAASSWIWVIVAAAYLGIVAWAFRLFVRTVVSLPESSHWMGVGFGVGVIFGLMNVLLVAFMGMMIYSWLKGRKDAQMRQMLLKYYDLARRGIRENQEQSSGS